MTRISIIQADSLFYFVANSLVFTVKIYKYISDKLKTLFNLTMKTQISSLIIVLANASGTERNE